MAKVYVMTQQEDEEQLADVLLLLVAIQGLVTCTGQHMVTVSQDCYSCHKIVIGVTTFSLLSHDSHRCHNSVISVTGELFVSPLLQVCHHYHKTHWCHTHQCHWYHKIVTRVARLSVSPDCRLYHQCQRLVISHQCHNTVICLITVSHPAVHHNQSNMCIPRFSR